MSSSSSGSDRGDFPCVALLMGSEMTLRDAARDALRKRVLGGASGDFDEARFDLASAGVESGQVLSAARTLPVLAPGRLVRVRGLDDRRAQTFLERDLVEYLENPLASTCLLLEADRPDRRLRWVKAVQKRGELIDCSAPSRPAEVRDWIAEQLRVQGKRPGAGAAAALYDAVGADLDRLRSEIDKLVTFCIDRQEVSTDDVVELTGQVRALAIWDLTDAVGARDRAAALRALTRLLDQGEAPLAVLGALSQHFRRLLRAAECSPLRAQTVQKALGMHPFAAEKLVRQLARFDRPRLVRCLRAMGSTDAALKGAVPLSPRRSMEQLLLAVT